MKEQAQKFGHFLKEKIMPAAREDILKKENIVLNCKSVTPEEAIRACGRLLLESGCIDEGYIQAMLERDASYSVAVGSHVAIPHGDNESRRFVRRTGLAVMTYPDGINWNGEKVQLVIGIASLGNKHLEILERIAALAKTEEETAALVDSATAEDWYQKLCG